MARTYYYPRVGIKGADADIEVLRLFLEKYWEQDDEDEDAEDNDVYAFFAENGINENPLQKGEKEFILPGANDDCADGTSDPEAFFAALASNYPRLEFFCWAVVDSDNGNGGEYHIFKNGRKVDVDFGNEFYTAPDWGDYGCTHLPADAYVKWVRAEYEVWRLEGDAQALADAKKAAYEARGKWADIADFMYDGGLDCLNMDENTLMIGSAAYLEILLLLENENCLADTDYAITQIETIDFSESDDPEEWEELPDLSAFTGLKTLNLTGCCNITELPPYITEKVEAGTLEVIGFPSEKGEDDDSDDDEDDDSDDVDEDIKINSEADALAFVRENPYRFEEIPQKYRTREICLLGIQFSGRVCAHIPEELQSEAFFLEAVRVNENGKALKYVPAEYRTEAVCRAALQAHPDALNADELNEIGWNIYKAGNYDAAIFMWNEYIKIKPKNAGRYNNLAYAYLGKKDYANAVDAVSKAIELEPEYAAYWDTRAEIHEAAGDYAKAAADARKALELEPDKESSQQILARCEAAGIAE